MGDNIVSLNLVPIWKTLLVRKRSPPHQALPSDDLWWVVLVHQEFLAVLNRYYVTILQSEKLFFSFLAEAFTVNFAVTLFERKVNSWRYIAIKIAKKNQVFRICDAVKFGKNKIEVFLINFVWLVKLLFVLLCASADGDWVVLKFISIKAECISLKHSSPVYAFKAFKGIKVKNTKCDVEPKRAFWRLLNSVSIVKHILVEDIRNWRVLVAEHLLKLVGCVCNQNHGTKQGYQGTEYALRFVLSLNKEIDAVAK
jgi:hypothetical protein